MKTLVIGVRLAIVLGAALPVPSVPAGSDVASPPAIAGHHEETPRK